MSRGNNGSNSGTQSLDDVWNGPDGLARGIEAIFSHDFPRTQYMMTYTNVYNYCTATRHSTPDQSRQVRVGNIPIFHFLSKKYSRIRTT